MPHDVALYGATGYTGGRILSQLLDMGMDVVIAGRSADRLDAVARTTGNKVETHVAERDDTNALRALCGVAKTVINAGSSFTATGIPLAEAAVASGVHYLDVSQAQATAAHYVKEVDGAAREAGVAILPGVGFIGALGDVLASVAARDLGPVDLEIGYTIRDWTPHGVNVDNWLAGLNRDIVYYDNGFCTQTKVPPTRLLDFTNPLGELRVVTWPDPGVYTIPRHLDVRQLRSYLTPSTVMPGEFAMLSPHISRAIAFGLRQPRIAALTERIFLSVSGGERKQAADDPTTFNVIVHAHGDNGHRTVAAGGSGIYEITAPIAANLAAALLEPDFARSGVLAASEVVDPIVFLNMLREGEFGYGIVEPFTPSPQVAR